MNPFHRDVGLPVLMFFSLDHTIRSYHKIYNYFFMARLLIHDADYEVNAPAVRTVLQTVIDVFRPPDSSPICTDTCFCKNNLEQRPMKGLKEKYLYEIQ